MAKQLDELEEFKRSLGKIELLTHAEELALGKTVKECWIPFKGTVPTTKEDLAIYRRGLHARNTLVRRNMRLVIKIAQKYLNRGMSFLDLIQEGSIGLTRAAEKFDYERGYKFSTYSYYWIRQAITRGIAEKSRVVKLPVHIHDKLNKVKKTRSGLTQELGRSPKTYELAKALGTTPEKLKDLERWERHTFSLDVKHGEKEDCSLLDLIVDERETGIADEYLNEYLNGAIEEIFDGFSPQSRRILEKRYNDDLSQKEVVRQLNVTLPVVRRATGRMNSRLLTPRFRTLRKEVLEALG